MRSCFVLFGASWFWSLFHLDYCSLSPSFALYLFSSSSVCLVSIPLLGSLCLSVFLFLLYLPLLFLLFLHFVHHCYVIPNLHRQRSAGNLFSMHTKSSITAVISIHVDVIGVFLRACFARQWRQMTQAGVFKSSNERRFCSPGKMVVWITEDNSLSFLLRHVVFKLGRYSRGDFFFFTTPYCPWSCGHFF